MRESFCVKVLVFGDMLLLKPAP